MIIKGVNINLESEDLKKVKNLKQLHKLDLFGHLSTEEQSDAENQLAKKIGVVADDPSEPVEDLH